MGSATRIRRTVDGLAGTGVRLVVTAGAVRAVLDDPTYATSARALADRIHAYEHEPAAVVERILTDSGVARQEVTLQRLTR